MIALVLSMVLLPATLLGNPIFSKHQDILDIPVDVKTLAKTKVTVSNELPVDTQITLTHWRGKDASSKQTLAWDYVFPSHETDPMDVQFETSTYTSEQDPHKTDLL